LLEQAGYVCTKAGGSLDVFDVIAIGPDDVRAIQVKSGSARLSKRDREAIRALDVAENVRREYWRFPDRRDPIIEPI
jgi:hypothetical protein